jgi:hypothetical protein
VDMSLSKRKRCTVRPKRKGIIEFQAPVNLADIADVVFVTTTQEVAARRIIGQ